MKTRATYLGSCWERFAMADGTAPLTKLYMYHVNGERQFALTEAAALASVAKLNATESKE